MNFGGKKKKSYRTQDPFIFYLSQSKANKSIARKKLIWTRIIMKIHIFGYKLPRVSGQNQGQPLYI